MSSAQIAEHLATAETSVQALDGILSGAANFPLMPQHVTNTILHVHSSLASVLQALHLLHAVVAAPPTAPPADQPNTNVPTV